MKKLESGRSMVEMLGVLAIIGVLSIGGIAGYTLSMRRYRANQVLDAINKYALVVYGVCQQAIINGDITDINYCHGTSRVPTFEEANLGTLADVSGWGSAYVGHTGGVDAVVVPVKFQDNEVCKTARSILGVKSQDNACLGNSSIYLHVRIKLN